MEASASDGHGSTPHGPMPQIAGFMREDHQTSQAVMIPKVRGFILRISVLQLCLRKKALRGCHLWSVSPLLQSQFFFVWLHAHVCVCCHIYSMCHPCRMVVLGKRFAHGMRLMNESCQTRQSNLSRQPKLLLLATALNLKIIKPNERCSSHV